MRFTIKREEFLKRHVFYVVEYKICPKIFSFQENVVLLQKGNSPKELLKVLAMTTIKELDPEEISEMICSLWEPLTSSQRDMLSQGISVERFKKNEIIYKEHHL